jgi:hypothetical protein
VGLKESAYRRSLLKILEEKIGTSNIKPDINPSKSILFLFDGTEEANRKKIFDYSQILKTKGKKVKLLSFMNSKGELMDFGMAVYNHKSINFFGFPKKHILELLEQETFDILFNFNIEDKKHLHALACKTNARFKISLPTKYPHNFTLILNTKEKKNINGILNEIDVCLGKLSTD